MAAPRRAVHVSVVFKRSIYLPTEQTPALRTSFIRLQPCNIPFKQFTTDVPRKKTQILIWFRSNGDQSVVTVNVFHQPTPKSFVPRPAQAV